MKIYRFSDGSIIREVAIHHDRDQLKVAQLVAGEGIPAEQILKVRKAIEAAGWQCAPVTIDGRDVLQVDGFKNAEEFVAFLARNHFVAGTPVIIQKSEKILQSDLQAGIRKFFRHHSLQLAGILNTIGDITLLGSGLFRENKRTGKQGDAYEATAGAFYTLGGLNLAVFGRGKKPESNLRKVSQRTVEYIQKVARGETPESAIAALPQNERPNFLQQNAAQNTLGAYTLGASAMLLSGIRDYQADRQVGRKGDWSRIGYGISSLSFKLLSLVIPEKSPNDKTDHDKNRSSNPLERFADWIREKPLRVFGYGSLITESMLALDTYHTFRQKPEDKAFLWKAATTASYIAADVLVANSNKDPRNAEDKFNSDEQLQVVALAAEEIAKQPQDQQAKLVDQVSEFLATQPEMKGKGTDISASLRQQIQNVGHNPWAERMTASDAVSLQPTR
jgi:hypothetical protein